MVAAGHIRLDGRRVSRASAAVHPSENDPSEAAGARPDFDDGSVDLFEAPRHLLGHGLRRGRDGDDLAGAAQGFLQEQAGGGHGVRSSGGLTSRNTLCVSAV